MSALNVGYVGLDHLHRDPFLALLHRLPVELVGACEPNPSFDLSAIREGEERPDEVDVGDVDIAGMLEEIPIFRDPDELFRVPDLDLVWITLPNRDTPGVIRSALEHGLHVVTEKPGARTASELADVAQLANDRGLTVGVNYFYRSHPIATELKSLVSNGFFGRLRAIDARYLGSSLDFRNPEHFIYERAASRGGALQWLGVHWIDLFQWVLGESIVRVNAHTTQTEPRIDVEDGATMEFETASGAVGTYVTGYYLEETEKDTAFDLFGDEGRATTTLGRGSDVPLVTTDFEDSAGPQHTSYTYPYEQFPVWGDPVLEFYGRMIDAIKSGGSPPAGIDDAVAALNVLDAAYDSANTGQWQSTGL